MIKKEIKFEKHFEDDEVDENYEDEDYDENNERFRNDIEMMMGLN